MTMSEDELREKMNSLESLLKNGLISTDEYQKSRSQILEEFTRSPKTNKSEPGNAREDPFDVLRKSLDYSKISSGEYKKRKKILENTNDLEQSEDYSEDYHILRMRLAYDEISTKDFEDRIDELVKEEEKMQKEKRRREKNKGEKHSRFKFLGR